MIRPALLYKDELQKKYIEQWYKPETNFYSTGANRTVELCDDNSYTRQFVSVDKDNNVIGYITYCVDWESRSAHRFGMQSFDKGNLEFVKDLYRAAYRILCVDKLNRMEWWCFTDNPAVKGYKSFTKRIGGGIVGEVHQSAVFPDGSLHDSYIFEIMRKDVDFESLENMINRINRNTGDCT